MYNARGGSLWLGDCLELMRNIPDQSVDMVLCDLPYGTTQNKWDSVIPFEPLWEQYWRVCRGAVVLTASQPFTTALVWSQIDKLAYDMVWNKAHSSAVFHAKRRPLKRHEDVLVFSRDGSCPLYNPQMIQSEPFLSRRGKRNGTKQISDHYGERSNQENVVATDRYPTTDLYFSSGARRQSIHPTQKPVALFEYLIRTYTDPGMLVLDNCSGSGTTAIAAIQSDRRWLCIERDPEYFFRSMLRIQAA